MHSKLSQPNTPPPIAVMDEPMFRRSYPYYQLSSQMEQNLAQIQQQPMMQQQQQQQQNQQQYLHNPNISIMMDPMDMMTYQMNNMNITPTNNTPTNANQTPTSNTTSNSSNNNISLLHHHPPVPQPPAAPSLLQTQSHANLIYTQPQQQLPLPSRTNTYSPTYSNDYYYDRHSLSSPDLYDENNNTNTATQMMSVMRMQQSQSQPLPIQRQTIQQSIQQQQQQPMMFSDVYYRQCEMGESMIYQQQEAPQPPRYFNDQYMIY